MNVSTYYAISMSLISHLSVCVVFICVMRMKAANVRFSCKLYLKLVAVVYNRPEREICKTWECFTFLCSLTMTIMVQTNNF